VRCKPTHLDEYREVATVAHGMPNLAAPFGMEWHFAAISFRDLREWFEPVGQEENDYLEARVDAYHREETRLDLEAFYSFAGMRSHEEYLGRFPRPKVQHAEGFDNVVTKKEG
jgi:hypothetical protein